MANTSAANKLFIVPSVSPVFSSSSSLHSLNLLAETNKLRTSEKVPLFE